MPSGVFKRTEEHKRKIALSALGNKRWLGKKHGAAFFEKVSGERNVNWKGDKVSYQALHNWVARHRGRPPKCEFCLLEDDTRPRYFNWANKSGNYLRDLNDWFRLCVPCHSALDNGRRKNGK